MHIKDQRLRKYSLDWCGILGTIESNPLDLRLNNWPYQMAALSFVRCLQMG